MYRHAKTVLSPTCYRIVLYSCILVALANGFLNVYSSSKCTCYISCHYGAHLVYFIFHRLALSARARQLCRDLQLILLQKEY